MTLDEAIKHCLEVAEENDLAAGTYELLAENNHNAYEKLTAETNSSRCAECATEHRQLAEWLTELKEAKRLLKSARSIIEDVICNEDYLCNECEYRAKCDGGFAFYWRYANEALALIGEDTNVPASADDTNVGHKCGARMDGDSE